MKTKKLLSLLLSLTMILTIIAPCSVVANGTPIISVKSITDTSGSTVNVDVVIENNPGILGATLKFEYDSGLTLLDATPGEAFSVLTLGKPGKYTSPCNFVWDGLELQGEKWNNSHPAVQNRRKRQGWRRICC